MSTVTLIGKQYYRSPVIMSDDDGAWHSWAVVVAQGRGPGADIWDDGLPDGTPPTTKVSCINDRFDPSLPADTTLHSDICNLVPGIQYLGSTFAQAINTLNRDPAIGKIYTANIYEPVVGGV